ncbi:MAG TPA: hypothetical protein VHF27_06830 [Acidimicrobiales bacterium]|nr:hypothetical protein [Acidimicrobiales bacterium]
MDPAGLRPLGVGEILDVAIKIYRSRFGDLIKAVLVVLGPVFVLAAATRLSIPAEDTLFESTQPGATPEFEGSDVWAFLAGTVLITLLAFVAAQVATGACFKAVGGAYFDEQPDWRASLRFARSRLGALLWLSFLFVVLLVPATLACIVPGVYLYVAWAVATPVLLLEDVRGLGALKRSRALVKGRWWPTVAVLLLVAILSGLVQAVFLGLFAGVVSASDNEIAEAVADAVAQTASSALTTPLSAAVLTVLYFDLRVRREGFDLELLARRLGVEASGTAPSDVTPPAPASPAAPSDDQPPFWPPPPGWKPRDG